MCEMKINEVTYKLHPVYDLFGADKNGNVISVMTWQSPERHAKSGELKVKGRNTKRTVRCDVLVFIWETHNGLKPKSFIVTRINGDDRDNSVDNLQLKEKPKTRFSPEERIKRDSESRAKWRNTAWKCPDCGFLTTNNASGHHRRVCKYTKNPYSEDEKLMIKNRKDHWKRQKFICELCHKEYSNNYRCLHMRYCRKKYCEMEG